MNFTPDTRKIRMTIRNRRVIYGDGQKFWEAQIVMWFRKQAVGTEFGARRYFKRRQDSNDAARAQIAALRAHRLFVVRVTREDISHGVGRDCYWCAISQALWRNQERMGFSQLDHRFETVPYGAWTTPRGIVLHFKGARSDRDLVRTIPAPKMPAVVTNWKMRGKAFWYTERMETFAMEFDDWYDSQRMTLEEWRNRESDEKATRPPRPSPCAFVLDLETFEPKEI